MRRGSRGFTLIELLVSVAIFSGIVILALGAFARSADSSIRSSAVRERTEAARSIVDRIGSDAPYIYTTRGFDAGSNECSAASVPATGLHISGGGDCLAMLLRYPGALETDLVFKRYLRDTQLGRTSLFVEEARNCDIIANIVTCDPIRTQALNDLMSDKFALIDGSDPIYGERPLFSGISPQFALLRNVTPVLELNIIVKPVNMTGTCSSSAGSCYAIRSSFVPGD